jgi:hypothetical protein
MNEKPNITTITKRVDEHFAAAEASVDELKRQAAQYDPKVDLVLSFRHGNQNGATVIQLRMPDKIIADVIFDYFVRAGVPVKLIQPTAHPDITRVLREAP